MIFCQTFLANLAYPPPKQKMFFLEVLQHLGQMICMLIRFEAIAQGPGNKGFYHLGKDTEGNLAIQMTSLHIQKQSIKKSLQLLLLCQLRWKTTNL